MKLEALLPLAIALAACHREAPKAATTPPANPPPAEVVPRTIDRGDGLTVEITKDGYGPASKIGDEVSVVYTARAKSSDQVIASSRDGAAPLRVRLGEKGVLAGLSRGLEGLRAGSVARIEVPPELGYGKGGNPGSNVPPDETLVFDVEVVGLR